MIWFHAGMVVLDVLTIAAVVFRPKWALVSVFLGFTAALIFAFLAFSEVFAHPDAFALFQCVAWVVFLYAPIVGFIGGQAVRQGFPRTSHALTFCAAVLTLVGIDAFFVEPHSLVTQRYALTSDKLTKPLRIVLLTDVQTAQVGPWEYKVFAKAMAEHPDLILLGGDYVQDWDGPNYVQQTKNFRDLVNTLSAPLGVFAVRGNVEHNGWEYDIFDGTAVNASNSTQVTSTGPVTVSALSFVDGFNPGLSLADQPGYHIALAHGPDFALGDIHADLLVAGHTHGGQVQVPLIGPLITFSAVPLAWAAGAATDLGDNRTLIVSRGIGMERMNAPQLRFACRPELVVIDVLPR